MACAVLCCLAAGCHTTDNPNAAEAAEKGTASVQIKGNTPGQIAAAAAEVFQSHGYLRTGKRTGNNLIFEKPGSKLSNLAYGNWIGDVPIWTRVKVSIIPTGEARYTLLCIAYNVRDRGGATEEEMKISKMSSGRYQKLLNEVAAKFRPASPASTGP